MTLGLYGTLNYRAGFTRNTQWAQMYANDPRVGWHMTQYEPGPGLENPPINPHSDILKAGGKKVILRTWFWNAIGAPRQYNWTDLYNDMMGSGTLFNGAVDEIIKQINIAGASNLYAATISEEEPGQGYGWNIGLFNPDHFITTFNALYDAVKEVFPTLRICAPLTIGTAPGFWPSPMTDTQIMSIKMDVLESHCYYSDLNWTQNVYNRIVSFGKEVFTIIWCSTPRGSDETNRTPDWTRDCYNLAKGAGISNIGFYAQSRYNSSFEWLYFNDYTEDPSLDAVHDPYGFKVVLEEILNSETPVLTGTISGNVINSSTGSPISGARVTDSVRTAYTDNAGNYALPNVPQGNYTIAVTASGYSGASRIVSVTAGSTTTADFALAPGAPGTGAIMGKVTNESDLPISGATVTDGVRSARTNSSGNYILSDVPEGTYTVTATATGYKGAAGSVTISSGETVTLNFSLLKESGIGNIALPLVLVGAVVVALARKGG